MSMNISSKYVKYQPLSLIFAKNHKCSMKILNFGNVHDFWLMRKTPCPRTIWATVSLRTSYWPKLIFIRVHIADKYVQLMCTRFTSSKMSKTDRKASNCRSVIDTFNHPSALYYYSSYCSANHVLIVWEHWRLKPPGLSRRQVWNFWEKVHQRKYFHKNYEFCVHQTCKFHTKVNKFYVFL